VRFGAGREDFNIDKQDGQNGTQTSLASCILFILFIDVKSLGSLCCGYAAMCNYFSLR
jgi:hypothetical protein